MINYNIIYSKVYLYLLNLILNYQYTDRDSGIFYKTLFEKNLVLDFRTSNITNLRGLIDTIYLISIHDFINSSSNLSDNFIFQNLKLSNGLLLKNISEKIIQSELIRRETNDKLVQILWFYKKIFKKCELYSDLKQLLIKFELN